jgi:hypothetical protein
MAIVGVEGLRALNEGTFTLRTPEELRMEKNGKHAKGIVYEVTCLRSMSEPYTVEGVAKRVGISNKTASNALEGMTNRKEQMFTKFKTPDIADYVHNYDTHVGKSWLQEALDDLTVAIDQLGGSRMANKLFRSNYDKLPWNYVPLMRINDMPVYSGMLEKYKREF